MWYPAGETIGGEMRADLVNPFVESAYELFQTMLSSKVARVGLTVSDGQKRPAEIMALIGFSGVIRGTVALSLPASTCRAMVERLLGRLRTPTKRPSATPLRRW